MEACIWLVGLLFLYIGLYIWNKKTPKPEGCQNITIGCDGCQLYDCTHNHVHKEGESN